MVQLWKIVVGIFGSIVTLLIAIMKGLISFGGTSELTEMNKDDIDELRERIQELEGRRHEMEKEIEHIKGRLEG